MRFHEAASIQLPQIGERSRLAVQWPGSKQLLAWMEGISTCTEGLSLIPPAGSFLQLWPTGFLEDLPSLRKDFSVVTSGYSMKEEVEQPHSLSNGTAWYIKQLSKFTKWNERQREHLTIWWLFTHWVTRWTWNIIRRRLIQFYGVRRITRSLIKTLSGGT